MVERRSFLGAALAPFLLPFRARESSPLRTAVKGELLEFSPLLTNELNVAIPSSIIKYVLWGSRERTNVVHDSEFGSVIIVGAGDL